MLCYNEIMKRHLGIIALVAACILSGINGPIIHETVSKMSPFLFGFLRVSIAFLIMAPLAIILRRRRTKRQRTIAKQDLALAALGTLLIYGVANLCFYIGMQRTSSINAAIIILLWPVLYFLMSIRVLKERFNKRAFTGIGLAFGGALLAVLAPMLGAAQAGSASILGSLLVLLCVFADIAGTLINKKVLKRIHPTDMIAIGLAVATVYYAFLAVPYFGQLSLLAQPPILYAVLYGAIMVGCVGYLLSTFGLKVTKSADVSITNYIQPITSILTAILFFNENFTPALAVGTAIVFLGLYLVEGHKLKGAHNHGHHR